MTPRHWWGSLLVIVLLVLFWRAVPRYEYRHTGGTAWVRVDRWTGTPTPGRLLPGGWQSDDALTRTRQIAVAAQQLGGERVSDAPGTVESERLALAGWATLAAVTPLLATGAWRAWRVRRPRRA